MCIPAIAAAIPLLTAGTAAAGGAAAGAATIGGTLSTLGTIASIGGTVLSGIQANSAAKASARAIEQQKVQERTLTSIKDQRARNDFQRQIQQQAAQIGARGFELDSPTAVFLGQTAAEELAFQSQSIRQTGAATQSELTSTQRNIRARGRRALSGAGFSAAGQLLTSAPELFPGLLS